MDRFGRISESLHNLALNLVRVRCFAKLLFAILCLYCRLHTFLFTTDVKIDFVVPTGAMGNIVGGYMAKKMGIPIGKLCVGTNINDITYRVMQTGEFYKSERMERTLSEAINIQLVRTSEDCRDILLSLMHYSGSCCTHHKRRLPHSLLLTAIQF